MTESSSWVDLASERVGGRATHANDEFFAEKENLLKEGRGVFGESLLDGDANITRVGLSILLPDL